MMIPARATVDLLRRPRPLILDPACQLQLPGRAVDWHDVFYAVVGVKAGRFDRLGRTEGRRQMIGADSAACTRSFHDETARKTFCTGASSETSQPVNSVSAPRLIAPRSAPRRLMSSRSARFSVSTLWSTGFFGRKIEGVGLRSIFFTVRELLRQSDCASVVIRHDRTAGQHGDEALRHQQRQRNVDQQKPTIADMQIKCTSRMVWKLPNSDASSENCTGFHNARPDITIIMPIRMMPR